MNTFTFALWSFLSGTYLQITCRAEFPIDHNLARVGTSVQFWCLSGSLCRVTMTIHANDCTSDLASGVCLSDSFHMRGLHSKRCAGYKITNTQNNTFEHEASRHITPKTEITNVTMRVLTKYATKRILNFLSRGIGYR